MGIKAIYFLHENELQCASGFCDQHLYDSIRAFARAVATVLREKHIWLDEEFPAYELELEPGFLRRMRRNRGDFLWMAKTLFHLAARGRMPKHDKVWALIGAATQFATVVPVGPVTVENFIGISRATYRCQLIAVLNGPTWRGAPKGPDWLFQ